MGRGGTTSDLQPFSPAQISLQLLPLQLLEVSGIQRKIIRMILTESKNKNNFPLIRRRQKLSVKIRIRIWPRIQLQIRKK